MKSLQLLRDEVKAKAPPDDSYMPVVQPEAAPQESAPTPKTNEGTSPTEGEEGQQKKEVEEKEDAAPKDEVAEANVKEDVKEEEKEEEEPKEGE